MTPVSKFALAVALGAFSMAPAAYAADKKDKDKAAAAAQPGQNYSPGFQKEYGALLPLLFDKDQKGKPISPEKQKENWAKAKAGWPALVAAVVNDDDRAAAGLFGTPLGAKLNDTALMRQAVDMALASPSLPANIRPDYAFQKSNFAYADKDYATAGKLRIEAYNAGYREDGVEYRIAVTQYNLKNYPEALTWMDKAFAANAAANKPVPSDWYGLAGDIASKSGDTTKASGFYTKMVAASDKPELWYAALENYRLFNKLEGEPVLDVYRLMKRTGALYNKGVYANFINVLDQHRYPVETNALIADGIKAGKITAADVAEAKARADAKTGEFVASLPETEASARAAKGGFDAMLAADDLFSNGDYAKARDLYALALTRAPIKSNEGTDETNEAQLRLGISKLYLNDIAGAKADLARVSGSLAPLANYWLIHIDHVEKGQPVG